MGEVADPVHGVMQQPFSHHGRGSRPCPQCDAAALQVVMGEVADPVHGVMQQPFSRHGRGSRPCPRCDAAALQSSVLDHILEHHKAELFLDLELDVGQLLTLLEQFHL